MVIQTEDLWVKQIDNPIRKTLHQWREDLYGYWMIITNTATINGSETVIARYYGTDRDKLLDIYDELWQSDQSTEILLNKRSNWMGGAFLAKAGG